MAHVQRFDHIGITVADLESATAFFVGLGLEVEGTGSVEGEFVETVCGIPGAKCEIAMLRPPGEGSRLELSSFVTPEHVPGSPAPMANEIGMLPGSVSTRHEARCCAILKPVPTSCRVCGSVVMAAVVVRLGGDARPALPRSGLHQVNRQQGPVDHDRRKEYADR